MNRRLSGSDPSLNATIKADGDQTGEWQDWLESDEPNQEESYSEKEEENLRKEMINESLQVLNDRERVVTCSQFSETFTLSSTDSVCNEVFDRVVFQQSQLVVPTQLAP